MDPNLGVPAITHEHRDPSVGPILWTIVGLAFGVMLVAVGMYGLYWYLAGERVTVVNPMANVEPQVPPAPRLEEHPAVEIQTLRSEEERLLSTYGWSDKEKGVVRVPIDKAMELELSRGFPVKGGAK